MFSTIGGPLPFVTSQARLIRRAECVYAKFTKLLSFNVALRGCELYD